MSRYTKFYIHPLANFSRITKEKDEKINTLQVTADKEKGKYTGIFIIELK